MLPRHCLSRPLKTHSQATKSNTITTHSSSLATPGHHSGIALGRIVWNDGAVSAEFGSHQTCATMLQSSTQTNSREPSSPRYVMSFCVAESCNAQQGTLARTGTGLISKQLKTLEFTEIPSHIFLVRNCLLLKRLPRPLSGTSICHCSKVPPGL